eukprot:4922965-Prymnesium_polylepis.1
MEAAKALMLARAGVFTVAATNPLKLDTAGERFQLLVRALEIHQFNIDWSLNLQIRKAAESLVPVWARDGSIVW